MSAFKLKHKMRLLARGKFEAKSGNVATVIFLQSKKDETKVLVDIEWLTPSTEADRIEASAFVDREMEGRVNVSAREEFNAGMDDQYAVDRANEFLERQS